MHWTNYFKIILLFVFFISCTGSKNSINKNEEITTTQKMQIENIHFYTGGTLTEVIERAEKQNKLVFLDMTADWCAPCKLMDENVYTYQPLYNLINKNFVSYKLDIEKDNGPNIAFLYQVKILPTLLFLDTKGRVLVKNEGSVDIKTFMQLAQKALDANK